MVLDEMHDAVETSVHGSSVFVLVAEVGSARLFLVLGDVQSMTHKLIYTLVLGC